MRQLLLALFVLSTSVAFADTTPAATGKLCLTGDPCVVTTREGEVVGVAFPRAFTWTASDERVVVIGTLAAGGTKINAPSAVFRVRLSADADRNWPVATELTIRSIQGDTVWIVPLSSRQAKGGIDLQTEPGEYEITVNAPGYRRAMQRQRASGEPALVTFMLQPLPRISGRLVSSKTKEPVAGGAVASRERVVAVSGTDGRFSFDADPDSWPETVVISAAGFGSSTVAVPRARANTDLLDLPLHVGASVEVTVSGPTDGAPLKVEIFKRRYAMPDEKAIRTKTLGTQSTVIFEGLEPGDYLVLARGTEPGQQYGKQISVALAEEKKVVLTPSPLRVVIRAELADTPLPQAHVELTHSQGLWHEHLRTDATGSANVSLWQPGPIVALVFDETTLPTPHREKKEVTGEGETEWVIRVSTREVRGQVIDNATGKAIANANVMLEVQGPQRYTATTKSGRDGRFVFTAAVPGEHRVAAAADGYRHDGLRYTFGESEQTHDVVIRLNVARSTRVSVRDALGLPVRDALVLDFVGHTLTGERVTDVAGDVSIPVEAKEIRDVFVVPRDGSFAAGTLRGGEDLTLRVVPAQATIVVTSVNTKKAPIPGVWVIVRHNGVTLPMEVLQALAKQQGAKTVGGPDGRIVLRHMPLGVYEFWPVGSVGEARAVMTGLGKDAPVTIVARPGLNEATLTFAEAKKP